jgi:hypothetical protein
MPRRPLPLPAALFAALLMMAGCATPPPQAAAPAAQQITPAQTEAAARYGAAMVKTIAADQAVQVILANHHVTTSLAIGLILEPNGYVLKGFAPKQGQDAAAAQAVLAHLINVNFGAFTPDMPQRQFTFVVPVRVTAVQGPESGAFAYQMRRIVLYQPNGVLLARACNPQFMANYVEQINAAMDALFSASAPGTGANAALVLGVKPSGAVRAWLVDPDGNLPADLQARIIAAAQAVPPMPVQQGPVAIALVFSAWGGSTVAVPQVPLPDAWTQAAGSGAEVPDGVFQRIWP